MNHGHDVADWWRKKIIDMEPGRIHLRGRPVQDINGKTGFAQMTWLMVTGETIEGVRAALFEATLVAAVDHGPQSPSIAAARMAATCGVGIQSAMATGLNMLGDVHGGAGEQAVAQLRHTSAGGQHGRARDPGVAWPLQADDHCPVCPCGDKPSAAPSDPLSR